MADAALAATHAADSAMVTIGSVLAERYELKDLLGEGGMGAVFRAYDRELDEDVALKVLHVEIADDHAALTRFRREVKLARRVTHRNVARTFDLGSYQGLRFLTMELIAGESLTEHAKALLGLPEVLRVAAEITRGLTAAHVVGVVHRDLKPDNVMITGERVVITDFGIARVAEGAPDVMRTGMIVGTPAYMAPEQLENRPIDGRTDIYALGTMLFELLTKRLPFMGESAISIATQRITSDAPDLRSIESSIPESLASLVHDMLLRVREGRPDAQTVLDRLEALRGNVAAFGSRRVSTLSNDTLSSLGRSRSVVVQPLTADAASTALAPVLTNAIAFGLTEARIANVSLASGDGVASDLIVQGSLHASGERIRARLRLVDGRKSSSPWAQHVDGLIAGSLDFEDQVVAAVTEAVRARTSNERGPSDPAIRKAFDEARAEFQLFGLPHIFKSIALLEEIEARSPGDPHVRAMLAHALINAWGQMGASDPVVIARVEELALRALDTDPTVAEAHHVIAYVRTAAGELAAGVRADEECLRLDPLYGPAHRMIGSLLVEALHVNEGRRRLELSARLNSRDGLTAIVRINTAALLDEREQAMKLIAEANARGGPLATVVIMIRLPMWWNDRAMAKSVADVLDGVKIGASWETARHLLRSIESGQYDDNAKNWFAPLIMPSVSPRHRSMMYQVIVEYYATMNHREDALAALHAAARIPLTDLLWMDRCHALDSIRDDPKFAEARAIVAARCADLWGSVGSASG